MAGRLLYELPFCGSQSINPALVHRPRRCFGIFPSGRQSRTVGGVCNSVFSGLVKPKNAVIVSCHKPAVERLIPARNPSAVVGAIIAVYVNALNREIVGISAGHGPSAELGKIRPLSANGNAPTAIISPTSPVRVAAPRAHILPRFVYSCSRRAMRSRPVANRLVANASAACGFSLAKIGARNGADSSAIACAGPKRAASLEVSGLCANGPHANPHPCHVDQSWIFPHLAFRSLKQAQSMYVIGGGLWQ